MKTETMTEKKYNVRIIFRCRVSGGMINKSLR